MKIIVKSLASLLSTIYSESLKVLWQLSRKKIRKIKVYKNYNFLMVSYGDLTNILYTSQHLVHYNQGFEYNTLNLFESYLKKDSIFLDVGANIGLFTLIASKTIGKEGKIYSFEPNPIIYKIFVENLKINNINNVLYFNKGLSDKEEKSYLIIPDDIKAQYGDAYSYVSSNKKNEKNFNIELTTIDSFMEENNLKKLDIIKIDIEGGELICLKGAEKLLDSINKPIIIFEAYEKFTNRFNYSVSDIIIFLTTKKYKIQQYDNFQWIAFPY